MFDSKIQRESNFESQTTQKATKSVKSVATTSDVGVDVGVTRDDPDLVEFVVLESLPRCPLPLKPFG